MPEAIFESVYAVSSEDPNYPAKNLLKHQPGKPWKTKNIGEKSAFVILQMSQSQRIIGIDIGNEHSAFIEVLVGKKACNPNDFKEILFTFSFMTPPESKSSTNTNRVRCFSKDSLVQTVLDEKWDLIKIVCTQPFNRQVKYGLCFIKIHIIPPPHTEANKHQIELEIENNNKKCLVPKEFLNKTTLSSSSTTGGMDRSSFLSSGSSVSSFSSSGVASPSSIAAETTKRKLFGAFNLREDSPDSEPENSSLSLFSRWKQSRKFEANTNSSKVSNAVAIRNASSPSSLQKHHDNLKPTKIIQKIENSNKTSSHHVKQNQNFILDRNRNDLLFNEEDEISNSKLEKKISLDQERIKKEKEEHIKQTTKKKRKSEVDEKPKNATATTELKTTKTKKETDDVHVVKKNVPEQNKKISESRSPRNDKNSRNINPENKKRHSSSIERNSNQTKKIKIEKPQEYRPFNKLLQGVTLVISGIQNPDRAELRRKALEMGAKYKPDWDSTCTHLISAFKNTPKYNQVKGHGKIVTRQWIEKCYSLRKRLPWRRYAIDDYDHGQSESEEEIYDILLKPEKIFECSSSRSTNNNDAIINSSTTKSTNNNSSDDNDDGSDTEDELERARQIQKLKIIENDVTKQKNQESISKINGRDGTIGSAVSVYDLSTEEEEQGDNNNDTKTKNTKKSNSKYFFDKLKFYIVDNNVGAVEEIKLKQIIVDNGGKIVDDILKSDYVITKEPIEISSKFNGELVKPLWVYECHDMECLIPTNRYHL